MPDKIPAHMREVPPPRSGNAAQRNKDAAEKTDAVARAAIVKAKAGKTDTPKPAPATRQA